MKGQLKTLYLQSEASSFIDYSLLSHSILSKFTPLSKSHHLILDRIDFLHSQIQQLTKSILHSTFIPQRTLIQTCDQIGLSLVIKKKCVKKQHYINQIIKSNKLNYLFQKQEQQNQQQSKQHITPTKRKSLLELSTMYSQHLQQKLSNLCIIQQTIINLAIHEAMTFITSFQDLDVASNFWIKRNKQKIMAIFGEIKAWHVQYEYSQLQNDKDIQDILASTLGQISMLNEQSDFDF